MGDRVRRIKEWRKKDIKNQYEMISSLPQVVVKLITDISCFIMYTLGMKLKLFGLKKYGFGTGGFTNLTAFKGIHGAHTPRISVSNMNWGMALNSVELAPEAEGGQIVIQKILRINFMIDNRTIDHLDIRRFQKIFLDVWQFPEKYL